MNAYQTKHVIGAAELAALILCMRVRHSLLQKGLAIFCVVLSGEGLAGRGRACERPLRALGMPGVDDAAALAVVVVHALEQAAHALLRPDQLRACRQSGQRASAKLLMGALPLPSMKERLDPNAESVIQMALSVQEQAPLTKCEHH